MSLHDINMTEVGRSIQLVGAIYADPEGNTSLMMLPGEPDHLVADRTRVVTLTADEWETFLRQTDLVEVEARVQDPKSGHIAKAIVRKSNRQISQHFSWVVYRRDEFKCRYCGIDNEPLTVDHLVTWESGGPSIPENLVASCRKCNGARGETPYAEWLNSPYYRKVSKGLDHRTMFANQALIATLGNIPVTPLKDGKKRKR